MDEHIKHLEFHEPVYDMVYDPLKYKGRGRPRKLDYISSIELFQRHMKAHRDAIINSFNFNIWMIT